MALSGQRLRVLEYLRAHSPVQITATAATLDLHPNTIREHLDALVGLGLAVRTTARSHGRGRPATLYRAAAADPAVAVRDYASLATVLAGHLARTSAHPERDARAAGRDWGRELADEVDQCGADPREAVLAALTRLGFAPDDEGSDGVALRCCPLLDAARRYPVIVCQVHLGIVEGMFECMGMRDRAGLGLNPFAEPGACRLFLPDPAIPPR